MAQDSDWLRSLPRSVRQRFDGLGKYVEAVLDEARLRDKLGRNDIQQIQIIVFVRALEAFLREGSEAASGAVDALAEFGIDGFRVGSELFSGRNDAVMRGYRLAEGLRTAAVEAGVAEGSESVLGLRHTIIQLAKELSSGERRMG